MKIQTFNAEKLKWDTVIETDNLRIETNGIIFDISKAVYGAITIAVERKLVVIGQTSNMVLIASARRSIKTEIDTEGGSIHKLTTVD